MQNFWPVFLLEIRRLANRRKFLLLLGISILTLVFVNIEIRQYRQLIHKSKNFREVEAVKVKMLQNNTQYSIQGIKLLFSPSALSIFFTDPTTTQELTARINQTITLSIYNNLKSESLFTSNQTVSFDFSGLILILGSLAALFLGFESLSSKEFLKTLISTTKNSTGSIYFLVVFIRVIALTTILLMISVAALIMALLNGIHFNNSDFIGIAGFLAAALITILFFFLSGVMAGSFNAKRSGLSTALLLWICFVFLIPGIIDAITKENARKIFSSFIVEQNQLKEVIDFEIRCLEKEGEFDRCNLNKERELVKGYLENEYQTIRRYENQLRNQIASAITFNQIISVLSPTTFYRMVCRETGSRGYENFLAFYDHLRNTHDGFVRFWLDRVLNHNPKSVVPYLRDRQLIFNGRSMLPSTYLPGIIILLLYNVFLYIAGYRRIRRLVSTPEDDAPFKDKDLTIELEKGKINAFFSRRPNALRDRLYQVFSGESPRSIHDNFRRGNNTVPRVLLGDTEITGSTKTDGFVFICSPSEIPPDIKPIHLERFFQRIYKKENHIDIPPSLSKRPFSQMEPEQRASVLLELLPLIDGRLFLLDCFGKKTDKNLLAKLKDRMSELNGNNATVIYLSPCTVINDISSHKDRDIIPLPFWEQEISALG